MTDDASAVAGRTEDVPVHRIEGSRTRTVEDDDCATRWGNDGLEVLSTPAILGHMERTCVEILTPGLEPGEMTVGTAVTMSHQAPAAKGDPVTYHVVIDRRLREIHVEFTVTDSGGTVLSAGRHQRRVVNAERLLRRLAQGTATGSAHSAR